MATQTPFVGNNMFPRRGFLVAKTSDIIQILPTVSFDNLDKYEVRWSLSENGTELQKGSLGAVELAPGDTRGVYSLRQTHYSSRRRVLVTHELASKQRRTLGSRGHELGKEQLATTIRS